MTSPVESQRGAARRGWPSIDRRWAEIGTLAAILVLAAVLRLPGLDQRGQWDSDQGHDMTVLAAFTQHGQVPLLGPVTSVGTFHHGALYYYLLAPAALVSGADPVAVTVEIALLGIAAVAATWWLARLVGGPLAAAVAAVLLAVSPAGVSESTFIWNPNPIPLFAALSLGGAIQARRTGGARWWLLAAVGAMATMQLHWLGGVFAIAVAAMWGLELRRRRRHGLGTAGHLRTGLAGAAILAAGYLPLLVHELTHDAGETRALLAYLAGGGPASGGNPLVRLLMVAVRSLTWPFAGLVTDHVAASLAALGIVVALAAVAWAWSRPTRTEGRQEPLAGTTGDSGRGWPVTWLLATLAFSVVALAVLAPSLAVVTPGLPNDHYHAFLDPLVVALVATGIARLVGRARTPSASVGSTARTLASAVAGLALAVLVVVEVAALPPAVSPDGGWRLADQAAARIVAEVDAGWPADEPRLLVGLPTFKPDDAMRFPLTRRGMALQPAVVGVPPAGVLPIGVVVTVCDPLFDDVTNAPCGDLAEAAWIATAYPPSTMDLADRFRAGDRRIVSIYAPSRLASEAAGP